MVEIPESLLKRSAEANAKALGVPVEQVLAEMRREVGGAGVSGPAGAEGGDGAGISGDEDIEAIDIGRAAEVGPGSEPVP